MNSVGRKVRPGLLLLTAGAALAGGACKSYYVPAPPIDCNAASVVPPNAVVIAGSRVTFWCSRPIDNDTAYPISPITGGIQWDKPSLVQDAMADPNAWPKWEASGGSIIGPAIGVTSITWQAPDTPGTATIRFQDDDLPTPVDPDCGNRDDDGVNPAASTLVSVRVPQVISVGQPSHTMYDVDPNKSEWDDSSVELPYPQYGPNHPTAPVCLTMGTSTWLDQWCRVDQPVSQETHIVVKADGTFSYTESGATFAAGEATAHSSPVHSIVGKLPNEIYCYLVQQHWKYRVPSGSNNWIDMNTTANSLFLTYGTPGGSCVTTKRIATVCLYAAGQTEPNGIAEAIFWSLTGFTYDLDAEIEGPTPIWLLYDGEKS